MYPKETKSPFVEQRLRSGLLQNNNKQEKLSHFKTVTFKHASPKVNIERMDTFDSPKVNIAMHSMDSDFQTSGFSSSSYEP